MRLLPLILFLFTLPALATDIDLFRGLEWYQPRPSDEVRLLGVYPAALPGDMGEFRVLAPEESPRTRYDEILAHVMLEDGNWLQERLVTEGRAMVMPVYERDEIRLQFLLEAEDRARAGRQGLWRKSPVVCAGSAKTAFDTFAIIQGRLTGAAQVGGTTYLNFGDDYRSDFTISISKGSLNNFPEEMKAVITGLTNRDNFVKIVEARGWVFFSGGPMIEVKTPVQLRFFEHDNPLVEEKCAP